MEFHAKFEYVDCGWQAVSQRNTITYALTFGKQWRCQISTLASLHMSEFKSFQRHSFSEGPMVMYT